MNARTCILAFALMLPPALSQAQNHLITSLTSQRFLIDKRYDVCPDMEASRLLAAYLPAVDSMQRPALGVSDIEMWVGRPECPLGNWTADVLLKAARDRGIKADVAVVNMGGLRASMPKDTVRLSHIFEIAPFNNRLTTLVLRGSVLRQLCCQMAQAGGEAVSGLRITCTVDGELTGVQVNGKPLDDNRSYIVATLDYLAEGNDRMTAFKQATARQDHDIPVRDVYIDYIRNEAKAKRHLKAKVEGRFTVLAAAGHQAPPQDDAPVLRILHTSDTHSQVLPISANITDKRVAGRGGYLRRAAFLQQQREQNSNLLLFDSGDYSQGTLFYSLYKGEVEVRLMNHMRYDAVAIGNHEFDNGLDNMARLFRMADFPIVCANYDFTGTVCEGLVRPYVVLHRGGLKIGVFGLGCQLKGMVADANCRGVRFIPPVEAADSVVNILRNQEQCDMVVCLSHLGWLDEPMADKELIAKSHGIDVVLGGHSHTYMADPEYMRDREQHPVPCFHIGKSGCFVSCFDIEFLLNK